MAKIYLPFSESSKPVQIRTYLHETPQRQNKHVQIRTPTPSSVSSEQEQTYTNSHPLAEDTAAEDLLAAGGANSGRFGARWHDFSLPRMEKKNGALWDELKIVCCRVCAVPYSKLTPSICFWARASLVWGLSTKSVPFASLVAAAGCLQKVSRSSKPPPNQETWPAIWVKLLHSSVIQGRRKHGNEFPW